MKQYLELLDHIIRLGELKPTRAMLQSTGERIRALSVFGYQMRFDLAAGFPAVTTKKLAFNWVVHELLWFLSGSTNIAYLKDKKVTIWDEWADAEGELGPVYGKQWRSWETPSGEAIDQIGQLLEGIEAVKADPASSIARRLIVSAWNPADVQRMALPPCHTLFQFSVSGGSLSCQLYQRSADAFLGVPFNIASYALMTHVIAHLAGLTPKWFVHTFGDVHVYENHLDQVREQLSRSPLELPELLIDPSVRSLSELKHEHIKLRGYRHHAPLHGEVAV